MAGGEGYVYSLSLNVTRTIKAYSSKGSATISAGGGRWVDMYPHYQIVRGMGSHLEPWGAVWGGGSDYLSCYFSNIATNPLLLYSKCNNKG